MLWHLRQVKKMNKMMRKLKKSKKPLRIIYYLIILAYIISFFFFINSLLALKGIETFIRIILIVFFVLYLIVYAFFNLLNLLQRKYKGLIITSTVSLVFILFFSIGSYYINYVYSNLNNITEKNELVYNSYLIVKQDTKFTSKMKVGIISKKIKKDEHDLAINLYKNEKLTNETADYDDYIKMLTDLYNNDIDAVIVPGNYVTLFQNEEGFNNISNDTKVVFEYSEKKKNEDLNIVSNKDFNEPLTFLLLGVDSENNGLNANAAFNGDTLMLVSFNPKTLNTMMLSIPRDTYVPIACKNNAYSKINSAAAYGTNCVINTINNFLDLNIDYYVKINFKGVVELVDALGGIYVDVQKPDFNSYQGMNFKGQMCEQNSDRLFGNKLVCVNPGYQKLNGEQALAYARNRHLYAGGDLDRVKHQQQVVEALANQAIHFKSISEFQKILDAISNNIATNMDIDTMLSGYQVIKNMLGNMVSGTDVINITKGTLETYSLNVYVPAQGRNTSAQGFYKDSLDDIKEAFDVVLGKTSEKAIKTFSFNVNEAYEINSPGKGKRKNSSGTLLPSFIGSSVGVAESFCEKNNIKLNVRYVDSNDEYYNSSVNPGTIGYQSVHKDVLLSTVSELTVYISNPPKERNNTTNNKTNDNSNANDKNNSKNNDDKKENNKNNSSEDKNNSQKDTKDNEDIIKDLLG